MLKPTEIRLARRHRIELILLGMVLAKAGDRAEILSRITTADIESELVLDCIQAVKNQDLVVLEQVFKTWGAKIDEHIWPGLLDRLRQIRAEDEAWKIAKDVGLTQPKELIPALTKALESMKDVEPDL